MEKVHCNVIRDLLPSYVDEITSGESNQIIEKHFVECESCKKIYESLKNHDFVADKANAEIGRYLKKAEQKKRMEHKVMSILTLSLFLVQLFLNFSNYVLLPSLSIVNCIFYPIYVISLLNILGAWKEQVSRSKIERVIFVTGGISVFYMVGMFYFLSIQLVNGETHPFGIAVQQTGPFLNCQIKILTAVYLLILILYFLLQKKAKKYNMNIVIILLAGITILWNIRLSLFQMVDFLPIKTVSIFLAIVIAESILLHGLQLFYDTIDRE